MSEVVVINEPAYDPVLEPGAPGFTDVRLIGPP
jgi:hypothetical protein